MAKMQTTAATLGARIKAARERKGLTQIQAAAAAGVSQAYWCQIESGQRSRLGLSTGLAIARVLTIDVTELVQ